MSGIPIRFTPNLRPGIAHIKKDDAGDAYLLVGEGTDIDDLVFQMNMSDDDRQFLRSLHIAPQGAIK
jgi:hypothetical protein